MTGEEKREEIREGMRKLAERYGPAPTILGEITTVSDDTCVIDDDGIKYNDVRLHVVLSGKEGQTLTPKKGAYGLAVRIEDSGDWFLVASSELDKWRLKIVETEVEQDEEGLLIKKGNDTLKQVLLDLVAGVEGIVVMQGTNPDYPSIQKAKISINNLLR